MGSFGLLLAATIGCGGSGKSPAPDACAAGSERCACYGNGTCNTGLLCLSHLCVRETGNDAAVDRASGAGGAGTGGVPGTGGTSNGSGGAGSGGSGGAGGTAAGGIGGTAAGGTSWSGGKGGSSQGGTAGGGKGGAGGLGGGAGGGGKGGAVGGAGSGGTGTGGAAGAGGTAGTGIAGAGGTATGGAGGAPTGGAGSGGMDAGGAGGDPGCAIVQCPASVPNCCKDWFAFVYDQATGLSRPDLVTSFSDTSTEVFATFNFENTNQIGAVGFDLTQEIDINYLSVVEGTSPSMIVLPSLSFETPTGDGSCLYAIYNNDGTYFETTSPEFYPCSNFTPGRAFKINFRVEPQYFTVQPGMGFGGVSVSSVGMIPF